MGLVAILGAITAFVVAYDLPGGEFDAGTFLIALAVYENIVVLIWIALTALIHLVALNTSTAELLAVLVEDESDAEG